jgi:SAM-dependent methyltransferase
VSFYGEDVAWIHEAGHGAYAREAAPDLLRRLCAAGHDGGLVVDLGCGSGVWARALLDAGYDVLGVDLPADLLAIARARAPEARFVAGSLLDAELPAGCAAVTAMSEVVNYAADPRAGRDALAALMRRVHTALRPGGLVLFDALSPALAVGPRRRWSDGDGWLVCSELHGDPAARALVRRVAAFRRSAGTNDWRRTDETHALCLHEPDDVVADLRAAGFAEVAALDAWGDLRLRPGHVGYAARRGG